MAPSGSPQPLRPLENQGKYVRMGQRVGEDGGKEIGISYFRLMHQTCVAAIGVEMSNMRDGVG